MLSESTLHRRNFFLGCPQINTDYSSVGNAAHAVFVAQMFNLPLIAPGDLGVGITVEQLYLALAVLFAYVFLDLDTARSFKLRSGAVTATEGIAKLVKLVCTAVSVGETLHLNSLFAMGRSGKMLQNYGIQLLQRLFQGGKSVDEVVWTIIPTIAAAVATQAQHFAQMLDVYLRPEYQAIWPQIQECAWSNDPADFEKLKKYALEANRIAPAAFGLLRVTAVEGTINDGINGPVDVSVGENVYTDFMAAGMDESVFPNPSTIDITRDRSLYIHHGYGPHKCLGRPIVEIAMAAQLRVFAKLKKLRRAPGLQGEMKSCFPTPSPGKIEVFMKEDWSDWWPFPTCESVPKDIMGFGMERLCSYAMLTLMTALKVHHEGFLESQAANLVGKTGLPHVDSGVAMSDMANGDESLIAQDTA